MNPIGRRTLIKGAALAVAVVKGGRAVEASENPQAARMELINRGDLSVLFGNSANHGTGPGGYCGIWSLTSTHQAHNAFVSSYAGFIFNSHRGTPAALERAGEGGAAFSLQTPSLNTRSAFTVSPPCYVDCETTAVLQNPISAPYLLQSWASYINSPEDGDIHFRHGNRWVRAHSPKHGVDATYCPSTLKDTEDDLRHLSRQERENNFVCGYSQQRFDEPFYYGRIRNMALAFFFDTLENIRFTISPSGGGTSVLPDKSCPAWDWLWLIPDARPDRPYRLRIRMVYKPFTGPEDILDEFKRWQKGLKP
ncbi:MAG: hypothetical protein IT210_18040 [Armatimonadetes bacterium]|nr:hypothetical protein [Armatimonadota bacterium]